MIDWLRDEGVTVAISTLSEFLEKQRSLRAQSRLLSSISSGAEQCKRVESEFARNPAPEFDTLIKLHRVLILNLTTLGKSEPCLLKLADQMTNTVLATLSAQTKAKFKEREVSLAESKAAEAKKSDQEKALEFCLEEAKEFPAVQKLFRDAFATLKSAKSK
jgi:transcriptional regulator of heat shock response